MHQAVHCYDGAAAQPRGGRAAKGARCGDATLGLAVLTSDPVVELCYRSGLVSIADLRKVLAVTRSPAVAHAVGERAHARLQRAARSLRSLRAAFEVCAARVRGLALDAETRLLQLGVPMNAVHPELTSPLREGQAPHHALYAGLLTLNQVLRAASHPASWAEQPGGMWDAVAASTGMDMRAQLVLLLSSLLPVEARLSYLSLRHDAYRAPGVCDLGGLVKAVLLRMMVAPFAPQHARRLAKHLKAAAPRASPFSLWLLRQCAAGSGCAALSLAARQAQRAADQAALGAAVDALFAQHQEQVLYSGDAWLGFLQALPTRHLVSFYIKYLSDSFQ